MKAVKSVAVQPSTSAGPIANTCKVLFAGAISGLIAGSWVAHPRQAIDRGGLTDDKIAKTTARLEAENEAMRRKLGVHDPVIRVSIGRRLR